MSVACFENFPTEVVSNSLQTEEDLDLVFGSQFL